VKVKGKSERISVFEVFDANPPEIREAKAATKTKFEQGLVLFHQNAFSEATRYLNACLHLNPEDSVAQIYLKRCQQAN
jgi:adenylate cyclase